MNAKRTIQIRPVLINSIIFSLILALYLLSSEIAKDESIIDSVSQTPQATTSPPNRSLEAKIALDYVANKYNIQVDQLVVVNEHYRQYIESGRSFQAFTLLEPASRRFFNLLVDLKDHTVLENIEEIQQAEDDAFQEKYGKLEPALYEKLQKSAEDDLVGVAIWVAGKPKRNERELFTELATRFPEAKASIEKWGRPFSVEDPNLRAEIEQAYESMLKEDTQPLVQPVLDYLKSLGYIARTFDGLPSITATLPKWIILGLTGRQDVGRIFLVEGDLHSLLNSAIPTNRAISMYEKGFDGSGSSIAMLELGNVDFTSNSLDCPPISHNCFRNPGQIRTVNDFDDDHATLTASAAVSNHALYKGVATGATIHSASTTPDTSSGAVEALMWALGSNPGALADVVNASLGQSTGQGMSWFDWAFDFWARIKLRTIVVASGNDGKCNGAGEPLYLCSPAKGWNVISVGAYDDKNNSDWSDDIMADFSSYENPSGDREKPEVVAPGVDIVGIKMDGILETNPNLNYGTSFAAPQIAGVAALLIQRTPILRDLPEASRAIIMASAVHNIDGPSNIPTGSDLKDGAGGVDVIMADEIGKRWASELTTCNSPCWWNHTFDSTNFPVGTYIYRNFNASKGEHIRVAISWWSHVDCPNENYCQYDRLDTNLNLGVIDPNGSWVPGAWSASWDNNYELVEFTAQSMGLYKIAIYNARFDEFQNYVGIALTKQASYIPDLRNTDGWDSLVTIRNNGNLVKDFHMWCSNGKDAIYFGLPANGLWQFTASWCEPGFTGSVTVDSSEDLSVMVESYKNNNEQTGYTGILPESGSGSPGWEQAGVDLFAPTVKRNRYGRSSTIELLNFGADWTRIKVYYFDDSGASRLGDNFLLASNGKISIAPFGSGNGCGANNTVCSAWIRSVSPTNDALPGQSIAAVVREYNTSTGLEVATYNLFNAGAKTIYFPVVKYHSSNMTTTGLRIQNTGSGSAVGNVWYYNKTGGAPPCSQSFSIPQKSSKNLIPDGACLGTGFVGTAVAYTTWPNEQPIVGVATESNDTGQSRKKAYSSFLYGRRTAYATLVYGDQANWYSSGVSVMNVSSQAAGQVRICYGCISGIVRSPEQ